MLPNAQYVTDSLDMHAQLCWCLCVFLATVEILRNSKKCGSQVKLCDRLIQCTSDLNIAMLKYC